MKQKHVLICEQSTTKLNPINKNDYTFEGVFTQFGVKNNNGRIYEEKEFLSHLEYLKKKIDKNMLVGELDHPEKFDVQFSKASHIIEKLEYNKEKRQIVGRIKLLDTKNGREAKALVDGGVQLSISSRAAGSVDENKKVHLKRVFTYDLVNDPGFEIANLHRISESLGFDENSNIQIYEFVDNQIIEENEKLLIKTSNMTSDEIKSTTEIEKIIEKYLNERDEKIQILEKKLNETEEKLEETYNYIQEELQNNIDYMSMIAQHTENLINYGDNITENQVNMKKYIDLMSDKINEVINETEQIVDYSEHIMETVENSVNYSEHIMETVKNSVNYSEHIMETVENSVNYSEHIMERLEQNTEFTEQIAEQAKLLEEHQNHFAEKGNVLAEFSQYIKDQLENYMNFGLNENSNIYKVNKNYKETNTNDILEKIDNILENAKKKDAKQMDIFEKYYNLLGINKKNEFLLLENNQREKVIKSIKENKPLTESEFIDIWDNALKPIEVNNIIEKVISQMPDQYKPIWEKLDSTIKTKIVNQMAFYNLNDSYNIKNFWETRKELHEAKDLELLYKNTNLINENVNNNSNKSEKYKDPYMNYVAEMLSKKM